MIQIRETESIDRDRKTWTKQRKERKWESLLGGPLFGFLSPLLRRSAPPWPLFTYTCTSNETTKAIFADRWILLHFTHGRIEWTTNRLIKS